MSGHKKMKERFKAGTDVKQMNAALKEKKRLEKFEDLKKSGGPFTDSEQVEKILAETDITANQRMNLEVQFACDSSNPFA